MNTSQISNQLTYYWQTVATSSIVFLYDLNDFYVENVPRVALVRKELRLLLGGSAVNAALLGRVIGTGDTVAVRGGGVS